MIVGFEPSTAYLYSSFGTVSIFLNALTLYSIGGITDVTHSIRFLMRVQCSLNVIALSCNTLTNLICLLINTSSKPTSPDDLISYTFLLGSATVAAFYAQSVYQLLIAINRFVAFKSRNKYDKIFSRAKTWVYAFLCFCYGLAHGGMTLHACCHVAFDAGNHKWKYVGYGAQWRALVTLANDAVVYPFLLICYIAIIVYMKSEMSNIATDEDEQKRERAVVYQFGVVALTWILYSCFYRSAYFSSTIGGYFSSISEVLRVCIFSVDAVVYHIFMPALRAKSATAVTCGMVQGNNQASVAPGSF